MLPSTNWYLNVHFLLDNGWSQKNDGMLVLPHRHKRTTIKKVENKILSVSFYKNLRG